ncbi:MAG: 3-deoxy-manno-octulosonate cytidylyltransferase [Methylotenera sp.]|nr:3-deoxy-manno-octulosonate cytidylyltransferase [Oligoflexia bacterium]
MKVLAVIPARFASTRLPGKPLADIHGKPMIQWVYERTSRAHGLSRVVVATDDQRVFDVVARFGGQVLMTSDQHESGTDRVAEVAEQIEADIYVNVQGDEPLIQPVVIEKAVELVSSGKFQMATVMSPLRQKEELSNPSVVKVVADHQGRALYFSRFPIPYSRGTLPGPGESFACRRHIGLYVYSRETLLQLRSLPSSPLEQGEMLEQLRALEAGIAIGIAEVNFTSIGVDTPEDLVKVRAILAEKSSVEI